MAHVKNNSGNEEWYTPAYLIEAARSTMGRIDVDPASNRAAQQWIQAATFYTREDNGLLREWHGCVWLNPPYTTGIIEKFIGKLLTEMEQGRTQQAVVIVNNGTETKWGQTIIGRANALCFPDHRVKFLAGGPLGSTPLQGQMIAGFKVSPVRFRSAFEPFGVVVINTANAARALS